MTTVIPGWAGLVRRCLRRIPGECGQETVPPPKLVGLRSVIDKWFGKERPCWCDYKQVLLAFLRLDFDKIHVQVANRMVSKLFFGGLLPSLSRAGGDAVALKTTVETRQAADGGWAHTGRIVESGNRGAPVLCVASSAGTSGQFGPSNVFGA
jgi:hypothetical protein